MLKRMSCDGKKWVLRPLKEYCTYIEPIVNQRWTKTGVPGEKLPDLPVRTWHLTCVPSEARTTVVRDLMFKSPHSEPLDRGSPLSCDGL